MPGYFCVILWTLKLLCVILGIVYILEKRRYKYVRKGTPIRRATGRKVWGVWDCKYCNTKVHGSKRECPNCGRPRGDVTGRYRLENPKDYMSEEDVATHQTLNSKCPVVYPFLYSC